MQPKPQDIGKNLWISIKRFMNNKAIADICHNLTDLINYYSDYFIKRGIGTWHAKPLYKQGLD
ncbi:MAG: Transposase [Candidatus Midichloria mitochondrii]|uniref:Uncharacterized protein n=1 Tax=Midichloria mitochondrii (strain IricVA) TaxID=696127 RepID=F7XW72_MIDMI|nr:hypothetical protein midi_00622 [Candidatus Midichloria mitochondrii IricVA]MDJ1256776.1 hypothetical protein [Candidatus Midichloria mitochondrii]MDJ1288487.1 hypothetical protein [Candidatus Midichloria mitochondrii]MDJ1313459.1 hypothetical protein [Candidatus Midichloria mitochondrii]